ncbi:MAG: hypothetical protein ACLSB9_08060 [Hydrogeniiclostridium mannosilyticum]
MTPAKAALWRKTLHMERGPFSILTALASGRGYFTAPGVTGEGQEMLGQGIYQAPMPARQTRTANNFS